MTSNPATTGEKAISLQRALDFIVANPDLPYPYVTQFSNRTTVELDYYLHLDTRDLSFVEQKAVARQIIRAVGGDWAKRASEQQFEYTATRDGVDFVVLVAREAVCERIVTGIETVTVPAVEAQPERTEVVETVEWRCLPLLADEEAAA